MDEAAVLRREISRLETGRGRRYPQELRRRVVAWASRKHRAGASWQEIKKELGLQWDSVRRWCQLETKSMPTRALVPVRVVPTLAAERLVSVSSPGGFRIEGLTLDEAAELLRALG